MNSSALTQNRNNPPKKTLPSHGREIARNAVQASYAHVLGRELDERERAIVRRIAFVARLMDNAVEIPGTKYRLGLDPLIGLIPAYGDGVSCAVSLYVLVEAIRLGTPPSILLKMSANIGIDLAVGMIPGLGDVFDAVFKANARNAQLIHNDVLGLRTPEGQPPQWEKVLNAAQTAPAPTLESPKDDSIEEATLVSAPVDAPVVQHSVPVLRERSFRQQAIGYTLVVLLVMFFLLPWVLLGYFFLGS